MAEIALALAVIGLLVDRYITAKRHAEDAERWVTAFLSRSALEFHQTRTPEPREPRAPGEPRQPLVGM